MTSPPEKQPATPRPPPADPTSGATTGAVPTPVPARPREIGGRNGPEPTRFGDWEKAGRCIDF